MVMAVPFLMAAATPEYGYRVVRVLPHDPGAFTQGLEFRDGGFYEGTGLEGQSSLRRVQLASGQVARKVDVPPPYFGEGITVLKGEIFQLTWQHQTGFVYGQQDLKLRRRFTYSGEGWGLTNDGERIYMSDGTAQIRVLDPATLREQRRITVRDGGRPVIYLNELEWVKGEIWANVWQTRRIARIAPMDGSVIGWIDLTGLDPGGSNVDVLNGIAYDAQGDRLFVTGKLWPRIYEIQVTPKVLKR
jgi:glutamine cyclotransferase